MSTCASTASARVSSMSSRRSRKPGASAAGRQSEPTCAAISLSQARLNPSLSKAPCHIVPHTDPDLQPSRKRFRPGALGRPSAWTMPWWIS